MVHSCARRRSKTRWHESITLQYAMPTTTGDASPEVTETITSSISARPARGLAHLDERFALADARQDQKVWIREPRRDGIRPFIGLEGGLRVA